MMTRRVPLHALHAELGARFTPFAGFDMPILYKGILDEHRAVRDAWGVFDVSHMSDLEVPLDDAEALAKAVAWDVTTLAEGAAKYTVACRSDGTILDDLIVYRLADRFHVVPNAGLNGPVAEHIRSQGAHVVDVSRDYCILAVQGPDASTRGVNALGMDAPPKRFKAVAIDGGFASGTGYTGEGGFELFLENAHAPAAFQNLVKAGAMPCGLGARDTLRLEKGYALASHEFEGGRSPIEAGLGWAVSVDHEYVGREVVAKHKADGTAERLVGLKCTERGIPRQHNPIMLDGKRVGAVTSGTQSPTLGYGIALAYVTTEHAALGTTCDIEVRPGRTVAAEIVKPPFL